MSEAFELDLTDVQSPEQLEAGPMVAPGWYRAIINDYYEDDNKEDDRVFEILIQGGTHDGRKLFYRFTRPEHYEDEKKAKTAKRRIGMLASRLGLVKQDDFGKVTSVDFDAAINREIVIEVITDSYDVVDEITGATVKKTSNKISYAGIFPLDHPDISDENRVALKLPPARPKATGATVPATNANGQPALAGTATGGADPFAGL
jgi:hypothetical protein